MGLSKAEHFSEKHNQISGLAKALAHPARIAILEYLMKTNACVCGDIVNELPLAQPTVSQHLKELKLAGFIKGNIEGNAINYCINQGAVDDLLKFLSGVASHAECLKNNCC
ncbi:MAG: metalloregulator ArsR/SmtB family transcription factor [Bacteroidetes bacterium]|nr:metalloregulator ArsR/SmtB family transcription factor [Bacteroidota bacterium]